MARISSGWAPASGGDVAAGARVCPNPRPPRGASGDVPGRGHGGLVRHLGGGRGGRGVPAARACQPGACSGGFLAATSRPTSPPPPRTAAGGRDHQRLRGLEVEPADVLEVAVGVGVLADGAVPRLQEQDAAGQAALRVVEVADQVAGRLDRRVGLSLGLPARPARLEPQPRLLPAPDEGQSARDHAAALGVGVQRIHGGRVDGELQIRAPREALDQLVGALGLPRLVVHDREVAAVRGGDAAVHRPLEREGPVPGELDHPGGVRAGGVGALPARAAEGPLRADHAEPAIRSAWTAAARRFPPSRACPSSTGLRAPSRASADPAPPQPLEQRPRQQGRDLAADGDPGALEGLLRREGREVGLGQEGHRDRDLLRDADPRAEFARRRLVRGLHGRREGLQGGAVHLVHIRGRRGGDDAPRPLLLLFLQLLLQGAPPARPVDLSRPADIVGAARQVAASSRPGRPPRRQPQWRRPATRRRPAGPRRRAWCTRPLQGIQPGAGVLGGLRAFPCRR